MVHVDYFLGCIKLETGGKVVAWLHVIGFTIILLSLITGFVLGVFADDANEKIMQNDDRIVAANDYGPSATLLALIALFVATVCIITVVIAYRSLNAINTRNHTRMFEMMALLFALTCFYLYVLFIQLWLWPIQCLGTLIVVGIYYYLFIVVYSHYRAFRKEYEQEIIRQQKANA